MPCKLYTFQSSRQDDDARLSVRGRRVALCVVGDWGDIEEIVRSSQLVVRNEYGPDLLIRSLGAADGWLNVGGMERDNPGLAYVIVADVASVMAELQMRGVGQPTPRRGSPAPVTSSPPAAVEYVGTTPGQLLTDPFYWLIPAEQDELMEGASITLNGHARSREIRRDGLQMVVRFLGRGNPQYQAVSTLEAELTSAYWRERPPGMPHVQSARDRRAGVPDSSPGPGRNRVPQTRAPIPGPRPGEQPAPPVDVLARTVRRRFVEDPEPAPEPDDTHTVANISVTHQPWRPAHFVTVEPVMVQWEPTDNGMAVLIEQVLEVMAQLDGHLGGAEVIPAEVPDLRYGDGATVARMMPYREVPAHREEACRTARVLMIMQRLNRGAT